MFESEWESEKAEMVREIDCLLDAVDSKAKLGQHLDTQLDMLQQTLDHEHIHPTHVEGVMSEAIAGMNSAERAF